MRKQMGIFSSAFHGSQGRGKHLEIRKRSLSCLALFVRCFTLLEAHLCTIAWLCVCPLHWCTLGACLLQCASVQCTHACMQATIALMHMCTLGACLCALHSCTLPIGRHPLHRCTRGHCTFASTSCTDAYFHIAAEQEPIAPMHIARVQAPRALMHTCSTHWHTSPCTQPCVACSRAPAARACTRPSHQTPQRCARRPRDPSSRAATSGRESGGSGWKGGGKGCSAHARRAPTTVARPSSSRRSARPLAMARSANGVAARR